MPTMTRKLRTRQWRKAVEKEWFVHFWQHFYPCDTSSPRLNIQSLSRNPNVSFEIIKANPQLDWDWGGVSANPNVTMEIIELNPDCPWNYHDGISSNPNLTLEFVNERMDEPWRWDGVSACPKMTLDIIEANPIFLWTWYFGISRNPNLTIDFIKKHRDKDWNWYFVSQNKNICPQDVEDNSDMPWDWDGLSYNPNITIDFVERNPDKSWNWFMLSCHPNITLDMVDATSTTLDTTGVSMAPWIQSGLSINSNIPLKTMLERHDIKWKWNTVASNSNLTFAGFEFLCLHKKINPKEYTIGINCFDGEKKAFTDKKAREYMASYRIQQYWWTTITNPYCDIGHRALLRSYNKLFDAEAIARPHLHPSYYGTAASI